MKFAVLGGSFNPVHTGHLYLSDAVLSAFDYDRVILVPAFESPFKIGAEGAAPRDRMDMLSASVTGNPRLVIDDCEINREGVSYTIDTLKDIISRYTPEGKPGLVLGDDLASAFYKWRGAGEIAELADIIIARRMAGPPELYQSGGFPCGGNAEKENAGFPYPFKTLENEILDISSRLVREKIGRGGAWRYLVPSGARYIIEDRRLYGYCGTVPSALGACRTPETDRSGLAETIARIENDARLIQNSERFKHSRGTALLAWDLARRFGLDSQKAYLAGIAHDICKDLGGDALFRLARADGGSFSKLEKKKPGLLHARAAAVQLKRKYGINDAGILEAVRYHTTGTKDMGGLAKAVYIADKIEMSRTGVDPAFREMSRTADLDTLFEAVLGNTVAYLKARRLDISYGTKKLLAAIQKRNRL